jgi:hypothetical protein
VHKVGQRYVVCPVCKGKGGDWSSTQDGREYDECPGCNDWLTVSRRHVAGLIRDYWLDGAKACDRRAHRQLDAIGRENAKRSPHYGEPYIVRRFAKGVKGQRIANEPACRERIEGRKARKRNAEKLRRDAENAAREAHERANPQPVAAFNAGDEF